MIVIRSTRSRKRMATGDGESAAPALSKELISDSDLEEEE
jgi:hypothetical protein